MRFGELDLFERMTDYEIVGMSLLLMGDHQRDFRRKNSGEVRGIERVS